MMPSDWRRNRRIVFIRLWMLKLPELVLGRQWQTTQCNPLINSVKVNSWFNWIDAEDFIFDLWILKGNILLFWPKSCLREIGCLLVWSLRCFPQDWDKVWEGLATCVDRVFELQFKWYSPDDRFDKWFDNFCTTV